ncbi:MAG: Sir2 family NAD-dependent protein deacetylase [Planctomycetota bacterium]
MLDADREPPRCDCGGVIKPDVVFFGEPVRALDRAAEAVAACDLLLVLGSSLRVYPTSWLPEYTDAPTVVVNRDCSSIGGGPKRTCIEADLDGFFREVAAELDLN